MRWHRDLRCGSVAADDNISGEPFDIGVNGPHDRRIVQIQRDPQSMLLMRCFIDELGVAKRNHAVSRAMKPGMTPPQADQPSSNVATLKPALRSGLQEQAHQVKKSA